MTNVFHESIKPYKTVRTPKTRGRGVHNTERTRIVLSSSTISSFVLASRRHRQLTLEDRRGIPADDQQR
jgi:hypothetical protein